MGSYCDNDLRNLRYADLPDVGVQYGHLARPNLHLPLLSRLLLRL